MAELDLTHTLAKFLDLHLVCPLLEFLGEKEVYDKHDLLHGKIAMLSQTNMVDYVMDIYSQLGESVPPVMLGYIGLVDRRSEVVESLRAHKEACGPLMGIFANAELVSDLVESNVFTAQNLEDHWKVTRANVEALYEFAKFQFECGNYSQADEFLYYYIMLGEDPERLFSAQWGKLGAVILTQNWEQALKDLERLRDMIEARHPIQPLVQLQQRAWLIHWSLFIFFNHPDGKDGIVEMFFQDRYMNTIQTACPHILRYLTTAVITNKRRRPVVLDLVEKIQEECYAYEDPVTRFVKALYVSFDFEGAQQELKACEQMLLNDFFLVSCRDEFMENARLMIFETYCRIHHTIDIAMLASRLSMSEGEAERWIVNLIRNAHLDAKIDSKQNSVVLYSQYPSVYQQIIEKTKGLAMRVVHASGELDRQKTFGRHRGT